MRRGGKRKVGFYPPLKINQNKVDAFQSVWQFLLVGRDKPDDQPLRK